MGQEDDDDDDGDDGDDDDDDDDGAGGYLSPHDLLGVIPLFVSSTVCVYGVKKVWVWGPTPRSPRGRRSVKVGHGEW